MAPTAPAARPVVRGLLMLRDAALSTLGIAALSACCLAAAEFRRRTQLAPDYGFLRWNLVLAWIPLLLSHVIARASTRQATAVAVPVLAVAWIVFLPNAPYLVTDLIHLRALFSVPNAVTLGLLAMVGLLIGVSSVQIVQRVVEERFGERVGWYAVHAIIALIAVGIYLGRVLRWNSWNVISHPRELVDSLLTGPSQPGRLTVGVLATLVFTLAFALSYRFLTSRERNGEARAPQAGH